MKRSSTLFDPGRASNSACPPAGSPRRALGVVGGDVYAGDEVVATMGAALISGREV